MNFSCWKKLSFLKILSSPHRITLAPCQKLIYHICVGQFLNSPFSVLKLFCYVQTLIELFYLSGEFTPLLFCNVLLYDWEYSLFQSLLCQILIISFYFFKINVGILNLSPHFFFKLCVSLYLKWLSYRQRIVGFGFLSDLTLSFAF